MTDISLQLLGLEARWPRLRALQEEVSGLEQRHRQAQGEVSGLQTQLEEARGKDLDAEARAVRSGKKPPAPKFEAEVKGKLESRQRDAEVLGRALEAARSDLAKFTAAHQRELYEDAVSARTAMAQRMAEHISRGLREYTLYADSFYVLKRLAPPPPVEHDENAPPARSLAPVLGVLTSQGAGPARGEVEAMLGYLIGLAPNEAEGKTDAA